ncbi:hypothetical protein BDW02DRAFT_130797 [Decorospora gaudefroyi]|uniref:Glycoprotease family protein n=1 Tax=Decorospora gaudefroyi TaxID=184978 RepID=A0A6A5KST1_9PLEO|nr:hypothetical protein BDW02DRAFT_130797 [Decorospora gaudefroyi]
MSTMRTRPFGQQPPLRTLPEAIEDPTANERYTNNVYLHRAGQEDDIPVQFNDRYDGNTSHERQAWDTESHVDARRTTTRRSSRSFSGRVSRQKSRRRELLGRQAKPGITVDTSFTRHRGTEPHQVFPLDGSKGIGSIRKSPWFGLGRSSTKNKGLGITKGTPQPEYTHRKQPSIDQNDPGTAISLTPGGRSWQDVSPWDRRIPIGISVPTDSVSDFSSLQANRHRAGSDATLVTPSIIITPAAVKSVWSPDTAFTESDYTPSVYSRQPFSSVNSNVPPVPTLPAEVSRYRGAQPGSDVRGAPGHARNDTLDSAGTTFEEDNDAKRKDRIMSTSTVFEEDETPLTARIAEDSLAIDTSMVPTPRRSQGWWNVITTPFVTTPSSSTWTQLGHNGDRTPDVPMVPTQYGTRYPAESDSHTRAPPAVVGSPEAVNTVSESATTQRTPADPHREITSPLSAMSASPVVGTAAIGTVLMPRQVEEPRQAGEPRQININIELQERRPVVASQPVRANYPPPVQQAPTSAPASQLKGVASSPPNANKSPQSLPVFAPPPKFAHQKTSHWSYDNVSRSSSQASSPDLKERKKHRKVCDIMSIWPFGKKRNAKHHGATKEKKKKKRGVCFWGCCCCLILFILLAIIIPVAVVLTRKSKDSEPTATQPSPDVGNQWLNLPDYPPIPTGILTIAQPEVVEEESGCVAPTTLWSCALPKELQQSVEPNKPDQPNFKIEITFENGTAAELPTSQRVKRAVNPVSAGAFVRSLLQARAAPSPSPAPPSTADIRFLGETTDGNSAPFEGEDTGLFISMQDPTASASRLVRRDAGDPTNITAVIPPPMLASDGTAAPANLLAFPSAQPLRLYNRGKDDEHYGFYNYFDRSIFLKQINGTNRGGNPADTDGGSTKDAANLRCTYSQTRFLVQIWTRSKDSKPLLQISSSDATDVFKRPGTFPYPVTVTIDRHGGDAAKKNLYCYEMEADGSIKNEESKKFFQFEDRGFGGNLVDGTQGQGTVTGPIDGGTGGCKCQWQNWL